MTKEITREWKKVRPSAMGMDPRFNRDFDERRAQAMGRALDLSLIGAPVLSAREDGTFVVVDAQHRVGACKFAGYDQPILCEVVHGLTLDQEASLFLRLNENRKSVGGFDKFKAQLVAKNPVALDIEKTLKRVGLRVVKAPAKNGVMAIKALERVYHRGNLIETLTVLFSWSDGEASFFEGGLIVALSAFLSKYPTQVNRLDLVKKLRPLSADRVMSRLKRMRGAYNDVSPMAAAVTVFREIYNQRRNKKTQLPPPDSFEEREDESGAAE